VVEPLFPVSVISTINWAEVITWLGTARNPSAVDLEAARNILDGRGLSTVEVTEAQAELAGLLNAQT
jgi:PIN domain nuclease of toxin-antitoxin system